MEPRLGSRKKNAMNAATRKKNTATTQKPKKAKPTASISGTIMKGIPSRASIKQRGQKHGPFTLCVQPLRTILTKKPGVGKHRAKGGFA